MSDAIAKQLQQLKGVFAARLNERLSEIDQAWNAVLAGQWSPPTLATLHHLTHSLAGAAATFGFKGVGDRARALDQALLNVLEGKTPLDPATRAEMGALCTLMLQAAMSITSAGIADVSAERVVERPGDQVARQHICIVDDDKQVASELARQIGFFGYDVVTHYALDSFRASLADDRPAAIVMDIVFPEGTYAGTDLMESLRRDQGLDIPVIFISQQTDLEARVRAVRAGGEAFFNKPLDLSRLVYMLDTLTAKRTQQPYHVLIVDDDQLVAQNHAAILEAAGFVTAVVSDPRDATRVMAEFHPEIILMDLYMPGISGPELAQVIHQQETYISVPIVFLSAEDDRERQLATIRVAGDDFLTKPIQPEHLVSLVSSRAQRYRTLRYFMERDGLTGALNHTRILDRLAAEVARADRDHEPLAFAMIDLDHFKVVNDTWGHRVGDDVLQSLTRVLKQRLRKSDIIGRYGGEEFALILPNTSADSAVEVLDDIRRGFAEVRFSHADQHFQVTFSGGIATYPDYASTGELLHEADAALYQAKEAGRNRIVLSRR